MESEQERFIHTMELLELEVAGLEQHEDLALVDRVSKLVGEIDGKITEAENKCECHIDPAHVWRHEWVSAAKQMFGEGKKRWRTKLDNGWKPMMGLCFMLRCVHIIFPLTLARACLASILNSGSHFTPKELFGYVFLVV